MKLLLASIVIEIVLLFSTCNLLLLGKSLPGLFERKQPIKHYWSMLRAIYAIAPRKTLERLGWATILSQFCFIMIHGEPNGKVISLTDTWLYIGTASINCCLLLFSVIAIITGKKKKQRESSWLYIREKAHYSIYGRYERYG